MRPLLAIFMSLFIQFSFLSAGCQVADSSAISNEAFRQAQAGNDVVILDVRTAEEFSEGHIPGSRNIDVLKPDQFKKEIMNLPKDKTYLLYCRSGKRSFTALGLMKENGFGNVKHLKGGISGWDGPVVQ